MPSLSVTNALSKLSKPVRFVLAFAPALLPLAPLPASAQSVSQPRISATLQADMAVAGPLDRIPVIVEMAPASAPFGSAVNQALAQQAVSLLNANGGQAYGGLSIIQGAAGVATPAAITALSLLPQVATIEEDSMVHARRPSSSGPSWTSSPVTSLYPQETNANRVWSQGGSGRNVTVAVLDSGVAPDQDLNGRILAAVTFAGTRDPARPDKGGHGTHIAGTIAGNGSKSNGEYTGMAPNANIVDVEVLDQNGNGRISSILRGMEWVLAHKNQFNIRVANLSLGTPSQGSVKFDPLNAGAEMLWKNGIVVVAAAGNLGPSPGTVESPGSDPYVITVGSTDDQGTLALADDTLGWWSSWGSPTDSVSKPDVVAPGRRIVSLRVPGSTLDTMLPDHVVTATNGATYMRLTGTSMSCAVVSGAVALMLEHSPTLTPEQVKKLLMTTTQPFGVTPAPAGAGAGLLDANAAWSTPQRGNSNVALRLSDGAARTVYAVVYNQPLAWRSATYLGTNWLAYTWVTLPWNDPTWDNIAWDNIAWDNIAWDNIAWDNIAWDNIAWDNIAWDSSEWNNIAWDSFRFD